MNSVVFLVTNSLEIIGGHNALRVLYITTPLKSSHTALKSNKNLKKNLYISIPYNKIYNQKPHSSRCKKM